MGLRQGPTWPADRREAVVAATLVGAVVVILGYASGLGLTTTRSDALAIAPPGGGTTARPALPPGGGTPANAPQPGGAGTDSPSGAAPPQPGTPPAPIPPEPVQPSPTATPTPAPPPVPLPPDCTGLLTALSSGSARTTALPSPDDSSLVGTIGQLVGTLTDPLLGQACRSASPAPAAKSTR